MQRHQTQRGTAERVARGLAYLSLAIGAAEMVAPRRLARATGLPVNRTTAWRLRAFGARECANGIALLARPRQAGYLWSRVAGDVLDLSLLGASSRRIDAHPRRLAATAAALLGVTAVDLLSARRMSQSRASGSSSSTATSSAPLTVEHTITVNRGPSEVYAFWRDFTNFPRFMRHIESVTMVDERRSRWRATGPAGTTVEWEADMVRDEAPSLIAWASTEGAEVKNSGTVRFMAAPGGRGTEVHVSLRYEPPGGRFGRGFAWLFGEAPEQQIREDLARFKQFVETGEVTLSDGPGLRRPAQPPVSADELRQQAGVRP